MSLSKQEFLNYFSQLQLSPVELARLLSVTPRTIHRWMEKPEEISGPAEQALHAWLTLKKYNLPWRPDCVNLPFLSDAELAKQIALHRLHAIGVENIIEKVMVRGGLSLPWQVDLDKGRVKLERVIEVMFHEVHGGFFDLTGYRRIDNGPIAYTDNQYLIEDAIFALHWKLRESEKVLPINEVG